jgi:NADH dehydrogenase
MKKRILILGGGFAGIYLARRLAKKLSRAKFEIVLVDKRNYFLFTPLLHEVASATISDKVLVESIAKLLKFKNVEWKVGTVSKVNLANKNVLVDGQEIKFDFLAIALGSTVQTYGVKGVEEFALSLKDLADAIQLKNRLISNFEQAELLPIGSRKRKMLLSISIIGAGPTGIELAGEISDFVDEVAGTYFKSITKNEVVLNLINATEKLLPRNNPKLGEWCKNYLLESGYKIYSSKKVTEIELGVIKFDDNTNLKSELIVWTAGVKPNSLDIDKAAEKDDGNRFIVDSYLRLKGQRNVFALGDIASGYPMLAQVAVQQAEMVARNFELIAQNKNPKFKFKFVNKGFLVSVGKWKAVGEVLGVPIRGPHVWILWHMVYFMEFISIPKKIKVLLDWILNVFVKRDISSY